MALEASMKIAASGMKVQGDRMRVISENLANADSLARTPGGDPYRRQVATFENVMNEEMGVQQVQIDEIETDQSDFQKEYRPGHPAANEDGYVKTPNVKSLVETADMREAQRSYQANLKVIENSRSMMQELVSLLR